MQTPKGFRDFLPEAARLKESVIATLKEVFSLYGFSPLETPAIEYGSTLLGKYGGEAEKLIYLFQDRGGRQIGLRYDLTVPLARVLAQYQNKLPIPFKRYQVAPVWRADKPQKGRYREFWQADIDIVGSDSPLAEAEIVACALFALERLGFKDYKILINDRRFLDSIGVTADLAVIIDKQDKVGKEQVKKELEQKVGSEKTNRILAALQSAKESDSIKQIKNFVARGNFGQERVEFDPWLSRGLEYYTGPIFEIKVGEGGLSIGGGGRYDQLIGKFTGRDLPAVGISFGLDRTIEALVASEPSVATAAAAAPKVLVTVFDKQLSAASIEAATTLRNAGISSEVYPNTETKLDKQLRYADQKDIPYVIIIGSEEAEKDTVTLKNMETGEQETVAVDELVSKLS